MQIKPNFDLLRDWASAEKLESFAGTPPCVAVFKCENKTLVYMCDDHGKNRAFDMVDMCFSDDFEIKPDVLLTEIENSGYERRMDRYGFQTDTLVYAIGLAMRHQIPFCLADLSDSQYVDVINAGFSDNKITTNDLGRILNSEPNKRGNLDEQMSSYLDLYGRDRFMLQNIVAALNKYDTVFAIFGAGHYEIQRLVLEDMMGKPEYITKIRNMRGDFSNAKIEPIKLCNFEIEGSHEKKS